MKIKLYNDIVFKWIFGRQEHTYPLIRLINSVICHEGGAFTKFSEIEILNPYDSSEPFKNEKQGILDIRAKEIKTNQWFDLEVQVVNSKSYPQRSKYYLAGLYRDQLGKSSNPNYYELRPAYGIHILVETLFKDEKDEKFWFNHYALLNTRSHKPLIGHWHLYYIELQKFLKYFNKPRPVNELEEWSYFIGTIQDNTKPLDKKFMENNGIKEVYDMLQIFTKDDRLREQYRLHEEFLRVQRTEQARMEMLNKKYIKEKQAKESALKAQEQERLEKTAALKAHESALKAQKSALQEVEKIKRSSILYMKKKGSTREEISQLLNLPLTEVEYYFG